MEGWNPSLGCTVRCNGCRVGGWVPPPAGFYARRDPYIDAVGRMDNPCDRPKRCPPCCKPEPKFRPPQEKPICDLNDYREEQAEAKMMEQWEKQLKACPCACTPTEHCLEVECLDPNRQLLVDAQPETPPEYIFRLREQPCKTDIIAGFFNPNDNKTPEQRDRERCDRFWRSCGPNLRPYPCRGAISYPPQRWVSLAEEQRLCYPSICEGSQYIKPEFIRKQREDLEQKAQEEYLKRQAQMKYDMEEWQKLNGACNIPGCPTGRCGCD